jgi:hypothetical protein
MTVLATAKDSRLRRLSQQLHLLGPRPLYQFLRELEAGADFWPRLERYAALAPLASFIAGLDGDQADDLHVINGGRR